MTLDEMEEAAMSLVEIRAAVLGGDRAALLERNDVRLARAVLLLLPVVRAAEARRDSPENRHGNGQLAHAVDALRSAMEKKQ